MEAKKARFGGMGEKRRNPKYAWAGELSSVLPIPPNLGRQEGWEMIFAARFVLDLENRI